MADLIDRQAAIDAMLAEVDDKERPNVELRWWDMGLTRASEILKQLPSAQPERKKGRWTVTSLFIKCSECGEAFMLMPQNYCPNCGARMEGEDNG